MIGAILLSIAGASIRMWLWARRNTARLLGNTETERDGLLELVKRVELAKKARRDARRTPNYLGGVRRDPNDRSQ